MVVVGRVNNFFGITSRRVTIVLQAQIASVCLLLSWGYTFRATLQQMLISSWQEPANRHCVFVPFIFILLLINKKEVFAKIQPTYNQFGLLLIASLIAAWVMAVSKQAIFYQWLCIITMLPAIFLLSCGLRITKALIFPLGILLFILPFGDQIMPTVYAIFLKLLNGTLQGNNLLIYPEQKLELGKIIQCINYMPSFILGAVVYSYFMQLDNLRGFGVMVATIVLPIAFLLLGMHMIIRLELLIGQNILVGINQECLGWFFATIGLGCSVILAQQIKPLIKPHKHMRNFNWQQDVVNNNFIWFVTNGLAVALLLMAPIFMVKL